MAEKEFGKNVVKVQDLFADISPKIATLNVQWSICTLNKSEAEEHNRNVGIIFLIYIYSIEFTVVCVIEFG